jgi:leucyl/phenylalanyl-tRNA--protein transferase
MKLQGPHRSFSWRDLVDCYAGGVFPMADSREDDRIFLVDPEERGVLPLDRLHVPRRLARTVRADPFEIRIDTAFGAVLTACAAVRTDREGTWINRPIERLYNELFARGLAHSVETWRDGALVGGLYGVSLGAAFFGESMFSAVRDASKVALIHLAARLRAGRYQLLDTQFITEHLAQFGAEELPRTEYLRRLARALEGDGDFHALPDGVSGAEALRTLSPAS